MGSPIRFSSIVFFDSVILSSIKRISVLGIVLFLKSIFFASYVFADDPFLEELAAQKQAILDAAPPNTRRARITYRWWYPEWQSDPGRCGMSQDVGSCLESFERIMTENPEVVGCFDGPVLHDCTRWGGASGDCSRNLITGEVSSPIDWIYTYCDVVEDLWYLAVQPLPPQVCEGNPCDPITGRKLQTEKDYTTPRGNLEFSRYYSSWSSPDGDKEMGSHWRHTYKVTMAHGTDNQASIDYPVIKSPMYEHSWQASGPGQACKQGWNSIKDEAYLGTFSDATSDVDYSGYNRSKCKITTPDGKSVTLYAQRTLNADFNSPNRYYPAKVITEDGSMYVFHQDVIYGVGYFWKEQSGSPVSLEYTDSGWIFTNEDNVKHIFTEDGVLMEKVFVGGERISLDYDEEGKLISALSNFGSELTFEYDGKNLIRVNTPSGFIEFEYTDLETLGELDSNYDFDFSYEIPDKNLQSVIYHDGTYREYLYESPDYRSHLTGIVDENGNRYATWDYDELGRVILSEHAGAGRTDIVYGEQSTQVTGPNGDYRTYHVVAANNGVRIESVTGDRCTDCKDSQYQYRTYDDNGYLATGTDWNGVTTSFVHDETGLELSRTEAAGTPQERTVETEWHSTYRLPVKITTPTSVTSFTYDGNGNLLSRTESARGI